LAETFNDFPWFLLGLAEFILAVTAQVYIYKVLTRYEAEHRLVVPRNLIVATLSIATWGFMGRGTTSFGWSITVNILLAGLLVIIMLRIALHAKTVVSVFENSRSSRHALQAVLTQLLIVGGTLFAVGFLILLPTARFVDDSGPEDVAGKASSAAFGQVVDWLGAFAIFTFIGLIVWSLTTGSQLHRRLVAPGWLLGLAIVLCIVARGSATETGEEANSGLRNVLLVSAGVLGIAVGAFMSLRTLSSDWIRSYTNSTQDREVIGAKVGEIIIVIVVATLGFAMISTVLLQQGVAATTSELNGYTYQLTWSLFGFYAWNLLDAVPVFEVPQTLNWEYGYRFDDHVGGALVLGYKVLIAIPIIQLARILIDVARNRRVAAEEDRPVAGDAKRAA
jgi:hypothetical protein